MTAPAPQPDETPPDETPPDELPPAERPMDGTETTLWVVAAHAGALVLSFVAPLLVMLIGGPRSTFVRRHAIESLNFQITMLSITIGWLLLLMGMVAATDPREGELPPLLVLGFGVFAVLIAAMYVLPIVATIRAGQGRDFRYPIAVPIVR
ncbi:MAG: DUF4870 domain-containing protein [Propionibacteriales bacterium]|nr:DUF4870 domain-containing protein [Propionibacteriales bacterium]